MKTLDFKKARKRESIKNSMRVLVIGDPHFKKDNSIETDSLHFEIEKHLKIQETSYDFIVCLGDVVDQVSNLLYPLDRINTFFKMLIKYAKLYVLIGNHDRPNNQHFLTEIHPFTTMKMWPGERIVIVDTGFVEIIAEKEFWFVPYVPPGRFEEALQNIRARFRPKENLEKCLEKIKTSGGCIFSHQEFFSSVLNVGILSSEGDKWDSIIKPIVINGHIHRGCLLQANILHVGTPYQVDMGDLDQNKGIVALHFSMNEPSNLLEETLSANPLDSSRSSGTIFYEKIPLDIRKKISIEVKARELIDLPNNVYLKFAHLLNPPGPLAYSNPHIRLVIYQTKDEKRYIDAAKILFPFENLGIRIKREFVTDLTPKQEEIPKNQKRVNFKEKIIETLNFSYPDLVSLLAELSFD